ncbi:MAG: hypothetical protein RL329_259 [Bacteroidota bacterium]
MLIKIQKDAFETSNSKAIKLLIDEICYHLRYELFIDLESIEQFEKLDLYNTLDADYQEIIKRSFIRVIQQSLEADFVIAKNPSENTFTVNEAMLFLQQPVSIILEHSENDAHFLNALIKHFKKKSKKIQQHKDNNWLQYVFGGGSTIEACVTTILKRYENLPKASHHYIRCFVLRDSDKEHPSMQLKTETENLIIFLQKHKIPYHILEKREMENYMPDIVFETIENKENRDFIQAYLRLSPIQKDFFDIEKGFPDKNWSSFPREIQDLYKSVGEKDITVFRKKKVERHFKTDFPKWFLDDTVKQANLLERTHHQTNPTELQDILAKITKLL